MGIKVEGPSFLNVARVVAKKETGAAGAKWINLVAVGHDGKEMDIAAIFDTHELEVLELQRPARALSAP